MVNGDMSIKALTTAALLDALNVIIEDTIIVLNFQIKI